MNKNSYQQCIDCLMFNICKKKSSYGLDCRRSVPCCKMPPAKVPQTQAYNERDKKLLETLDFMEGQPTSSAYDLTPRFMKYIKEEVLFIMGERDGLKEALKSERI